MKLTLNEEQSGLKLIQVNDGFVVVDTISDIKINDWYYGGYPPKRILKHGIGSLSWQQYSGQEEKQLYQGDYKIIFATSNLNLESVPVIEENENNLGLDYVLKLPNVEYLSFEFKKMLEMAVLYGYKQAQQNLFTEEQIREYFELRTTFWRQTFSSALKSSEIKEEIELAVQNSSEEAHKLTIQSLKQPRVEITFENDKPIKCVML